MRRSNPFLIGALATSLAIAGPAAVGVLAQDDADELAALECIHDARELDAVIELFGEVAPAGAGEAASLERHEEDLTIEKPIPLGVTADDETVAQATAAVVGLIDCFNAGHLLGGWGGVTDEFLVSQVDTSIFDEDFVAQIEAGPEPLPLELHTSVVEVRDVLALEDGRVGVLLDYHGPASPGEGIDGLETDFFILRDVDGLLLLDEVIENLESQIHGDAPDA